MSGALLGQLVGRQFGSYLGRQLALGACREDRDDALSRRLFTPRLTPAQIPPAVDLRPWTTPIEDQGSLGSCAANALIGGLEYLVRRETGQAVDLSRIFVYFNQRLWDECVRDDLGASIGDGVRVLSRVGAPIERSWPYHRDLFAVQPPEAVYREASKIRVADWWSVPVDADAFRGCLAAGFPIAFGTKVTESFVNTPRTGLCGMPTGADDARHGRHALLIVGYDDRARRFVVRNSWGDDWGDRGHVYMPYDYVLNRRWTRGCWALRLTAREAFDDAHVTVDLSRVPKAPPGGATGGSGLIGGAASMGAQVAVGAFTGSGLLAGLAGGLISGLTPGVSKALRGRDQGAYLDVDRSDAILAALRGDDPPIHGRSPWDDGHDEEAIVPQVSEASRTRRVRAAGSSSTPIQPLPPKARPAPPSSTPARPAPAPRAEPILVRFDLVNELPAGVLAAWREAGAGDGALGGPVSRPSWISEGPYRGQVVRFVRGAAVAWAGPPGRSAPPPLLLPSSEACVAKWLALGAGDSIVGWPVGPVGPTSDGGGSLLPCTRGTILHHPSHGAHPIHGALFARWRELGGLTNDLGYPIGDPELPDDPRSPQRLAFERGALLWSADRGIWRE